MVAESRASAVATIQLEVDAVRATNGDSEDECAFPVVIEMTSDCQFIASAATGAESVGSAASVGLNTPPRSGGMPVVGPSPKLFGSATVTGLTHTNRKSLNSARNSTLLYVSRSRSHAQCCVSVCREEKELADATFKPALVPSSYTTQSKVAAIIRGDVPTGPAKPRAAQRGVAGCALFVSGHVRRAAFLLQVCM